VEKVYGYTPTRNDNKNNTLILKENKNSMYIVGASFFWNLGHFWGKQRID
jgi:hypothetical protein